MEMLVLQEQRFRKKFSNRIIVLISFLFANCYILAGDAKANFKSSSSLLASIPFSTLTGGIIILRVTLNDLPDTLNFILDTGSGGISLDSSTVSYYHLPVVPSNTMVKGISNIKKVNYVPNQLLHFSNLEVNHLDFFINDYTTLSRSNGIRINGIIGYSFLKRYVVKVNYDKNLLEIFSPGKVKYPKRGMLIKPRINGIPVFDACLSDSGTHFNRFYFDTGAGLGMLVSESYERDSSVLKKGNKITVAKVDGPGGEASLKLSVVRQIKIGNYTFKKVPVHILKDEYNVTEYPTLGGVIGNDVLRRFNLVINYGEMEIHLTPNSHFRDPFDYSYTGLYMLVANEQVIIEDVLKGSPGEKAGLEPGDVLVSIDNISNGDLQFYLNLLRGVGARLKIVIMRNGKIKVTHLKVMNIL